MHYKQKNLYTYLVPRQVEYKTFTLDITDTGITEARSEAEARRKIAKSYGQGKCPNGIQVAVAKSVNANGRNTITQETRYSRHRRYNPVVYSGHVTARIA